LTTAPLYVIDASIGAKTVVREPDSPLAVRFLRVAAAAGALFLAPANYASEAANVLWKHCRLLGDLTWDEAEDGLRAMLATPPVLYPLPLLAEHALQLALHFRRPVYDCFYVALAQRERCPLVTADRGLVNQLGDQFPNILSLEQAAAGLP